MNVFNKNGEEITSSITVGDRFFTSNQILEKVKKRVAYTASELKLTWYFLVI